MQNIIITAVIAAAVLGALVYIYRSKKAGKGCVGCPYSKCCSGSCSTEKSRGK